MLLVSATPRLQVRRPSPTVAEFTVTTLLAPTPALRLLRALLAGLRLFLGLATLLVVLVIVLVRWAAAAPSKPPSPVKAAVLTCASLLPAGIIRLTLPLLLAAGAGVLFLVARRFHVRESLLVLRGLGVQTSESSSYLTAAATRFIPTEKIQDIFVNEAFRGFEVRYYLVIVVDGEPDLIVVFPKLLPSRKIVETVWRGARECLYEGRAEDKG